MEILDGIGSAEMFHIYISNRPDDVAGRARHARPRIRGGDRRSFGPSGRRRRAVACASRGSTALCYWGDKVKSNETFQGAWCSTADVFRRDEDGVFWYVGRGDDLLKVSGIWVSPLEIENALLDHDAVHECCVLGREDAAGLREGPRDRRVRRGRRGERRRRGGAQSPRQGPARAPQVPALLRVADRSAPRNDRGKIARKLLVENGAGGREFGKLTWPEAQELFQRDPVALLPVGATEAHGPHLPLDTDVPSRVPRRSRGRDDRGARGPRLRDAARLLHPRVRLRLRRGPSPCARRPLEPASRTSWRASNSTASAASLCNAHLELQHVKLLRGLLTDHAEVTDRHAQLLFPDITRRRRASTLGEEFLSGECHAGRYEASIVMAADPDSVREDERKALAPKAVGLVEKMLDGAASFLEVGVDAAWCGDSARPAEEGRDLIALATIVTTTVVEEWPELAR